MATYDYVFLGAGPASLAAANVLSGRGVSGVLILDAGPHFSARGCPGLADSTCVRCAGDLCRVTNGVGGAAAGFGNKLCHLPASEGFRLHIPPTDWPVVSQSLDTLVGRRVCGSQPLGDAKPGRHLKHYDTDIMHRQEYRGLIGRLLDGLGPIEIGTNCRVEHVQHGEGRTFSIHLADGRSVRTRNVVLATGRSGHAFAREVFDELDVAYQDNAADIGIRLEAETSAFREEFFYQDDPKYKFEEPEGVARTFCTCRGGVIVPVKHGHGIYADGAFRNTPTGRTNVALMVRALRATSAFDLEQWVCSINRRMNDR